MIKIRQLKLNINHTKEDLIVEISNRLKISKSDIKEYFIKKQSIDARYKPDIYFVYEIDLSIKNEERILRKNLKDVEKTFKEKYITPNIGSEKLNSNIVVVGSGPSGLFVSYLLAENNYNPLIIERGDKIDKRIEKVEKFWNEGILDLNSNVQFGEGGAGTFSDGKLNTLVKDKYHRGEKVFETFIKNGAPSNILYLNKPHIGTDLLRNVVSNMRNEIINMGGKFRYNTTLTNLIIENGRIEQIEINNKELIDCDVLILCIGHSARDTFKMLHDNKLEMTSKPFAVGLRISHPQELINESQYGVKENKILGPAFYKLTYNTKDKRGVYSFCMCPGGYIVNASSENNKLVINGMSNHKRDNRYANSAVVVTVSSKDFGNDLFDGMKFQRSLEEKAFVIGKGMIPVQTWKDFKNNTNSKNNIDNQEIFKGKYLVSNLNDILPDFISDSIKEAIPHFGTKIKGFDNDNTIMAAIETRTSSPIRIIRDENYESNIKGIYPCGEGAGYAGGITTSAIDGLKVAEVIIKKYSNK